MNKKESPKITGISDITGKLVKVRHATEADMGFIEEKLKKHNFDTRNLDYREFTVATENANLIGFGRLKKTDTLYEVGCIIVVEEREHKGIGQMILEHLLEYAPVDKVYVMTDLVDYFRKLGFTEIKKTKESGDIFNVLCDTGKTGKKVLMSYDRICK